MVDTPDPWISSPARLELSSDAVDIWRCPLNLPAAQVEELGKNLSEHESQRADRFRFSHKRDQFVISRARLRQCLALVTGKAPADIQIEIAASGKPYLTDQSGSSGIQFNLSHCKGLALIAITRGNTIGIDVETLEQEVQHLRLARNFFSEKENLAIAALAGKQVAAAFFACWTRKEAVLKAIGTGIAFGLDSFDVSTDPEIDHCQTLLRSENDSVATWNISTLPCGSGFAGALASLEPARKIRYWRF